MTLSIIAEFPAGLAFPPGLALVTDTRVQLEQETRFGLVRTYKETSHKISKLTNWAGIVTAGDKDFGDFSARKVRTIIEEQPPRDVPDLLGLLRSVFEAEFSAGGYGKAEFLLGSYEKNKDVFAIHYLSSPSFEPIARSPYAAIGYLTPEIEHDVRVGYEMAVGVSQWPAVKSLSHLAGILSRLFNIPSVVLKVEEIGEYLVVAELDESSFRYGTLEIKMQDSSRHYRTLPIERGALVIDFVRKQAYPVPDLTAPLIFAPEVGTEIDLDDFEGILQFLGIDPEIPPGIEGP